MKMAFFGSLLLVFLIHSGGATAQPRTEVLKPLAVYSPRGFDSNDNAQVVIAGAYTGYCMKAGLTQHRVEASSHRIYLSQTVSVTDGCSDLAMYIPYSSVINLGALAPGVYEIFVRDSEGKYSKMGDLPIAVAASAVPSGSTDERVYAPINSIQFEMNPSMKDPALTLSGVLTNSCLSVPEISIRQTARDVVEVLPVIQVRRSNCQQVNAPFSKKVVLRGFPLVDTLLHVRAMNGQSINKVITQLDRL